MKMRGGIMRHLERSHIHLCFILNFPLETFIKDSIFSALEKPENRLFDFYRSAAYIIVRRVSDNFVFIKDMYGIEFCDSSDSSEISDNSDGSDGGRSSESSDGSGGSDNDENSEND